MRRRPALGCFLLVACFGAGCQGSGGEDLSSGLTVSFSSSSSPAPADVVFLRLHDHGGSLITLDVVGRTISAPLDGVDLVLGFEPSVLEAFGVSSSTFLGTCGQSRPDNTILLCADSVSSGAANSSGAILFSAFPQGASPVPVTINGDVVLASVTFRALARGSSSLLFHVAANPGPGGSVSRVTSAADPAGAAAVTFDPEVTGVAVVEVTRR